MKAPEKPDQQPSKKELDRAERMGHAQGVCESVISCGREKTVGKRLLSDMKVTQEIAKKYAKPETYKEMERGIFAPELKLEQSRSRSM